MRDNRPFNAGGDWPHGSEVVHRAPAPISPDAVSELRAFVPLELRDSYARAIYRAIPSGNLVAALELRDAGLIDIQFSRDDVHISLTSHGRISLGTALLTTGYKDATSEEFAQALLPSPRLLASQVDLETFRSCRADPRLPDMLWGSVGADPRSLFSDDLMSQLERLDRPERLAYLAHACSALSISPSMVGREYFSRFPGDLDVVRALFFDTGGASQCQDELCLLNVSIPHMAEFVRHGDPPRGNTTDALAREINCHRELADRREHGAKRLLAPHPVELSDFGEDGERVDNAIYGAWAVEAGRAERGTVSPLDLNSPPAELLTTALANCQYFIVARDCYYSLLTSDDVLVENRDARIDPAFQASAHSTVYSLYHSNLTHVFGADQKMQLPLDSVAQSILAEMRAFGGSLEDRRALCESVIDFWRVNRNPLLIKDVAQVVSTHDASHGVTLIMKAIREEGPAENHLTSLLHHLDPGVMSVGERGVEYLGCRYDLGDLNRAGYVARRLDAQGRVGVYDDKGALQGIFNPTYTGVESARPIVSKLTTKDLLFGVHTEERAVAPLVAVSSRHAHAFNHGFLERTGVHFQALYLYEQGGYVQFVSSAGDTDISRAEALIRSYGLPALRSFIGLQFDSEMSEKVLRIGEQLPFDLAEDVFTTYSRIVERVQTCTEFLRAHFVSVSNVTPEMIDAISLDLLKCAKSVLGRISDVLAGADGAIDEGVIRRICRTLNSVHEEVSLFSTCFREVAKVVPLSYADVVGCAKEAIAASSLSDDVRAQILHLGSERTIETYPDPDYAAVVLSELEAGLRSTENIVHFVHFGEHVLAFCRASPADVPGAHYVGSLNSHSATEGTNVGFTLAEDVIQELGRDKPIYICVGPGREKLARLYCRRFKFERYGVEPSGKILLRRAPTESGDA